MGREEMGKRTEKGSTFTSTGQCMKVSGKTTKDMETVNLQTTRLLKATGPKTSSKTARNTSIPRRTPINPCLAVPSSMAN